MDDQRTENRTEIRSIASRDLCPWLLLFRCPGLALRTDILILATAGGVLSALAWGLSGWIFYLGSPNDVLVDHPDPYDTDVYATFADYRQAEKIAQLHQQLSHLPGPAITVPAVAPSPSDATEFISVDTAAAMQHRSFAAYTWQAIFGPESGDEPLQESWRKITQPYLSVFSLQTTARQFGYLTVGSLLSLLVWSVFGGAITRAAAMQLARDQRIGLGQSLRFALGKVLSYFASPLLPLFALALFTLGVFLLVGLPMNADVGLIWSGLVWIIVLALGLLVGVLLLGLLFGWPLMWATISTEGTDTFDALSRTYAYTLQRPLHYLLYVVLVGTLGALTWLLVLGFAEAVIHISWWAADWGVFNEQRMDAIVAAADGNAAPLASLAGDGNEVGSTGHVGIYMFRFANGALRAVACSFAYGFFWVAASAIYLLLRRDVDHTETDEIYLDDDSDSYGLPPLTEDEAGVPTVDEPNGERGT